MDEAYWQRIGAVDCRFGVQLGSLFAADNDSAAARAYRLGWLRDDISVGDAAPVGAIAESGG